MTNAFAKLPNVQALTASMGDGVYALDASGRVTFMNAAAEEMLGWTEEELRGKPMHDVIHNRRADGTSVDAGDCPLLRVLTDGRIVRADDDVFIRRDGTMLPVAYTSSPVMEDGRVAGAVLVFRDTTEERVAAREREALRERAEEGEKRLRELIGAMPVQVWSARPDGTLRGVSPQMIAYSGQSQEAILNGGLRLMMHPSDVAMFQRDWREALTTGEPLRIEVRLLRGEDYKYLWHIIRAVPCRDTGGAIREWIGTNADIDAEKRAVEVRDAALTRARIERERLMRVFTSAPAVMAIYRGPNHVITMVNPLWEQFVGKRNVIGKEFAEVFPELRQQGVVDILHRVYESGEMFRSDEMRVMIDRGNGAEETCWSFVLQQLKSPDDSAVDVLAFAIEVTGQVLARR